MDLEKLLLNIGVAVASTLLIWGFLILVCKIEKNKPKDISFVSIGISFVTIGLIIVLCIIL